MKKPPPLIARSPLGHGAALARTALPGTVKSTCLITNPLGLSAIGRAGPRAEVAASEGAAVAASEGAAPRSPLSSIVAANAGPAHQRLRAGFVVPSFG
jgi:hypothetical protein